MTYYVRQPFYNSIGGTLMAGWDHNLIGQEDKVRLVRMLPVSKGSVRTVGDIVDDILPDNIPPVQWYFDTKTRLQAQYIDDDREHYPSGRIIIKEIDDCCKYKESKTAQAVQLLFDILYPRKEK